MEINEFAVSKSLHPWCADQHIRSHAVSSECGREFIAEAVISCHAENAEPANSERREIVGYCAAGSGCYLGPDNADSRNLRLARRFRCGGIVCAPTVQANIAYHQRRKFRESGQDFGGGHA